MPHTTQEQRQLIQSDSKASFVASIHEDTRPDKSTYEKEVFTYWLAFVASWIFSLGSVIPATYTLFWFVYFLYKSAIGAWAAAITFVAILEILKHLSSHHIYKSWFFDNQYLPKSWLFILISVFGISIASSIFGAVQGNQDIADNNSPIEITRDSSTLAIESEIAAVKAQNKRLEANKNHEGVVYFPSQKAMEKNNQLLIVLQERLTGKQKRLESQSDLQDSQYQSDTRKSSIIFIILVVLLELGFELCKRYMWSFKRRVYIEAKREGILKTIHELQEEGTKTASENATSNGRVHNNALEDRIHELEGQLSRLTQQLSSFRVHSPQTENSSQNSTVEISNIQNEIRRPIGFVQNRVHEKEDVYTIDHQYRKNGKVVTVHYTLPIIKGRVAQYARKIEDAQDRVGEGHSKTLDNIHQRYHYWKDKETQLIAKLKRNGVLSEVLQKEELQILETQENL
ncbi:MAG: hypothetical protein AAF806_29500 [Bacteroidota bacterium]